MTKRRIWAKGEVETIAGWEDQWIPDHRTRRAELVVSMRRGSDFAMQIEPPVPE